MVMVNQAIATYQAADYYPQPFCVLAITVVL
jgi:hypothetical protein